MRIADSNRNAWEVQVALPGIRGAELGQNVQIREQGFDAMQLFVRGVSWSTGKNGDFTKLVLGSL
jgi:hypothetical protein